MLHLAAQVAVAVMRTMDVPSGQDAAAEAQLFAKALHDAWGVGLRECNNGVLLLLSVDDRQVSSSSLTMRTDPIAHPRVSYGAWHHCCTGGHAHTCKATRPAHPRLHGFRAVQGPSCGAKRGAVTAGSSVLRVTARDLAVTWCCVGLS